MVLSDNRMLAKSSSCSRCCTLRRGIGSLGEGTEAEAAGGRAASVGGCCSPGTELEDAEATPRDEPKGKEKTGPGAEAT